MLFVAREMKIMCSYHLRKSLRLNFRPFQRFDVLTMLLDSLLLRIFKASARVKQALSLALEYILLENTAEPTE